MHVHFKFMLLLHAAMLQKQERNIQKHKFMLHAVCIRKRARASFDDEFTCFSKVHSALESLGNRGELGEGKPGTFARCWLETFTILPSRV